MADLIHFLRLMASRAGWMALGGVAALLATACGLALLGMAGAVAVGVGAGLVWLLRPLALGRAVLRYLERLISHEATFRVLSDVRLWFFDRVTPLVPGRIVGLRAGDLLSRLVGDVDALDGLYMQILTPSVIAAVVAGALAVLLGSISPAVALAVLVLLALAGLMVPALAERAGRAAGREQVESIARLRQQVVDATQGLVDLIANQAVDRALDHAERESEAHGRAVHLQSVGAAAGAAATQILTQSALIAVLVIGVLVGEGGVDPMLVIAAFVTLAAFEAVAPLPLAYQMLGRTRAAARRLRVVAETAPAVRDPDAAKPVPAGRDIRLEGVCFTYPGADTPAIDGVDLVVAEGERVAIVGPSGSGKSTLFALLLRFHDADEGCVRIGGADLRALAQEDHHARLGVLSQSTPILAGTLRDNLLLGSPDAGAAAIEAALASAGLTDFVEGLPAGLDTWLGEAGVAVSGGEARRVALARVVLRDAPILLLDEPTEGLDAETERAVLAALEPVMAGRTVVMITHRPAVAEAMERVLYLEAGRLVG